MKGYKPLFWFGHGLSYTRFALSDLAAQPDGKAIKVSFSIRNIGKRAGKGVAPGLCRARRLAKGRLGSAQAARRVRQGRAEAGPEPSASS